MSVLITLTGATVDEYMQSSILVAVRCGGGENSERKRCVTVCLESVDNGNSDSDRTRWVYEIIKPFH